MKNDYEMYQSLLSRYDEYQEKKKKHSIKIKRTIPVIASFCFVVSLGFAYQKYYSKIPIIPQQPDIITETTEATTTKYAISGISTTHIATTATHTTTVTVETKTKQIFLTTTMQTEIIDNTVQTEAPTIVTQAPTTNVTITETKPNIELTTTTISTIMTTTITPITQPIESTTTIDNGENGGGGEGGGLQCVDMPFNEKYFLADLQTGASYFSAFMRISADMIETDIDMATLSGFDSFYNKWYECTMIAYSISGYSEDEVIAVKADDTYYVYYNRLLDKERKNQIML